MGDKKAEEQLKSENGAIFNNKEKISNVLKTAVKEKLASMDCLIGKLFTTSAIGWCLNAWCKQ